MHAFNNYIAFLSRDQFVNVATKVRQYFDRSGDYLTRHTQYDRLSQQQLGFLYVSNIPASPNRPKSVPYSSSLNLLLLL